MSVFEDLRNQFALQDPDVRRALLLTKSTDPKAVMTDADWKELRCLTTPEAQIRQPDNSIHKTIFIATINNNPRGKPAPRRGTP